MMFEMKSALICVIFLKKLLFFHCFPPSNNYVGYWRLKQQIAWQSQHWIICCLAVHVLISINYYICFMDWASALCQTDYRSCHKQWSCAVLFGPTGAAVDSWYISGTNRISLTAFQVSFSVIIVYAYYRDSRIDIVFSFSKLCTIFWWIMCHFPVKRPIIAPSTQILVHRTRHSVLLRRRY